MPTIDITHPEVAAQWHPTRNGDLKPTDVTAGSNKKQWWICPKKCPEGCEHVWPAPVYVRTSGCGCPYCGVNGKAFCFHNSLEYKYPQLAKEWHPTKNGMLKPSDVSHGSSSRKVWWFCPNTCSEGCKHEWEALISNRVKGHGCPKCSNKGPISLPCYHLSLAYLNPELAKQWHPTRNGVLKASDVSVGSHKNVWWLCPKTCLYGCIHEWKTSISHRTDDSGCPKCSNKGVNAIPCVHLSIEYTHPEIRKQWHPTKNELLPSNCSYGSNKKVWWLCENGHEWAAQITKRCIMNRGCPHCINKTEGKLLKYLIEKFSDVQAQFRAIWCRSPVTNKYLPFDFHIPSLNLLIELDGAQHFRQISNWGTPENTRKKDVFKMRAAFKQGISIIRLLQEDVLNATDEWLNDVLLPHLVPQLGAERIFIVTEGQENIYLDHQRLLEGDEECYAESVDSKEEESCEKEVEEDT